MAAATHSFGTRLAASLTVLLLGIAAGHAPSALAQSMSGPPPSTPKAPATAKPVISGNPSRMLVAGSYYDFRPVASDQDSAQLQFAINKKPAWANFDPVTGRLNGTPSAIDVGRIKGIQVSVSDGQNVAKLKKFGIKVIAGQPPVIAGAPATAATEGQAYQFQPSASDADQQTLQFAITNRPSWASFDKNTGRLHGTPPAGSAGSYANIGIAVTDGATTVSLPAFTITVAVAKGANTPAKISGAPPTSVSVGQAYDFTPSASDPDGDTLEFANVNVPAWLSFDRATGRLNGTPQTGHMGTYTDIVISVSDGTALTFLPPFSITVTAATSPPGANRAPTISGTPATKATVGQAYGFVPIAADEDGDALSFSSSGKPAWLSFDTRTGRLSGTPTTAQLGTYSNIRISVSDGKASATLPAFSVTVQAATTGGDNSPPSISGTPSTVIGVGQAYSFQPTASDADGDVLGFGIANKPAWANFDVYTGRLSGTPAAADVGTTSNVVISVSDGQASATLPAFNLTVQAAPVENRAPTISGSPATSATVGQAYAFQPAAADADGDVLRFGIANKPLWANFDIVTGRLSGTPAAADVGTTSNIVISVSDGQASATLPAFNLSVAPPVIGSAELIWTAPTLNEDGSALTNLAGYKIRYGTSPGALNQLRDVVGAGITTATIEGLVAGTWYFSIASYTNTGVESAPTGAVFKTIQ
jgi:hypothetical protein